MNAATLSVRLENFKAHRHRRPYQPPLKFNGTPETRNRYRPHGRPLTNWRYHGERLEQADGHVTTWSPEDYFRNVTPSDVALPHIRHTGWYMDNYEHETMRGYVYQLPAHKGTSRFLAGYQETLGGGHVIDVSTTYEDAHAAARAADEMARIAAEKERDYQEREEHKRRIEEIHDERQDLRHDIRILTRELRGAHPGRITDAARAHLKDLRRLLQDLSRELAKLEA